MAGEIERYISPSIAFEVKPARSIQYHDKLMSSKNTSNMMEDYLINEIDENVLLSLLQSEDNKSKALQYLDQHLQENNGILIFHNKQDLFKGFALALCDPSQKLSTHCTKIISKIIPQLGSDLDKQMIKILSIVIANVGNPSVTLQKESIQALHVYMKHSLDVFQILHAIAQDGILHSNARIRQQIIRSFPTLLFAEFKDEDFFDVVHSLAVNLTETLVDPDVTLMILEKVSDFIGKDTYTTYLNRLPAPLKHTYNKLQASKDVNKLIDAKAPNRIEIHSKHPDTEKESNFSMKYMPALLDREISDRHMNNFAKSGHFNTAPRRRQHANMHSSLSVLPNYDSTSAFAESLSSVGGEPPSRYKELSFIPKHVIEQLSSSDNSIRLQAVETLKDILCNLSDPFIIKDNMVPLLSLLQPMFDDKNFRVACVALKAFSVMISYIGPNLDSCLKLFVYAVSRKLGNVKDSVRSECYKVLLQVMDIVGHQKVLNLFWDKLAHKQYKVREDFTCIVIATLLDSLKSKNKQTDLDFDVICSHIAPLLTDSQQVVRKAALDCIAVLGHMLGTTSKQLLSAVDSVELKHDNASGVMPAVHARLLRRQLPRLTENMLVEYAIFPTSTASLSSPQGADIHWILAAEKPKKTGTPKGFYGVQEKEHRQDPKRADKVAPEPTVQHQTRRHMSAGKHRQFPWAVQEDSMNSKHPSSAPVSGVKAVVKKHPPFRPRNTWGPESEIPAQFPPAASVLSSKAKSGQGYEPSLDTGPSYQELYKRRKEANLNKPSVSLPHSSKTDSGYKPSFGSNDFSASSSSAPSNVLPGSSALSSSCPSAFFENNTTPRPNLRRMQKKVPQPNDTSTSSAYGSEESTSPFSSMKPALARSASKRRDNAVANSKDLLKTDDLSEKIPVKLKNASASPRFDRLVSNNSVDQMRPMLKAHHNPSGLPTSERFPGPAFNHDAEFSSNDSILPGGYTPSTLQRKFKESMKNEQNYKSSSIFDKDNVSSNNTSSKYSNEADKSKSTARPIVPSNFSPARHRNYEDVAEFQSNAVSSIRRSAQNKRERLQSQPVTEESFNGSFSEFASEPSVAKASSSSVLSGQYSFIQTTTAASQPAVSSDLASTSAVSTETPSFKYSPNTGVTFDSKKTDTDVSVVGIRYPSQVYPGILSTGNTDSRASPSSPASTPSTTSNATVTSSKYISSQTGHDRLRSHRGSSLGMASSTASPDSANASFNIQGKGVFMTTSSTSLLSTSDVNDVSSSSSKEELSYAKSSSNETKDSTKLFDGVCGVAVRQPSLTPEEISLQSRRISDLGTEVSLSASLRERKKKQKEVILTKKAHSTPKNKYYDLESVSPTYSLDTAYDSRSKLNKTSPLRVNGSSNRSMYDRDSGMGTLSSKSGAGTPTSGLLPLDNPERSLADAVSSLGVAGSTDWEVATQAMYTIRRLVTYHPASLSARFHDVIVLLTKHVSSLRSQVSKASVQAINDLYTYLKKPLVDSDIEATVRALLIEHGKPNSFIKNESNKALQAIVLSATSSKILNALLSAGLRHKNKDIRGTTAKFCAELVDKMGPGKSLSGVKDTTDRLLEAVAVFVTDRSPEVRYYGRYVINELMVHEDFNRCLDRHLTGESAQEVKAAASSIKDRGLGSLSSVGSRKTFRKRNGSSATSNTTPNTTERLSPATSAPSRRKGPGTKIFNEQEQEELKSLCDDLSGGNFNERKSAIMLLFNKLHQDRRFVEDNIVKIMGAYVFLLSTAQTKINSIGLESLPDLIVELHPCLKDTAPQLVTALLKLVSSKSHCDLALKNIDFMITYIEHTWIIKPFATSAVYGTLKAKQVAILNLIKLIDGVAGKKIQIIDRQVLPVLWNLFSSTGTPSSVQLRKETIQLTQALYGVYGQKLYDLAEANNHLSKVKDILNPNA